MRSLLRRPSTWLRLALLVASAWALHREFAEVELSSLARQFGSYGPAHLSIALGATVASFLLLGGMEILALRSAAIHRRTVPARLALGTSFIAHALSQSVGLAILTGAAVRVRGYARRGLTAAQTTQVSTVVTLGVTLGLITSAAWVFIAARTPMHAGRWTLSTLPLGILLAMVVVSYLAWSASGASLGASTKLWHIPRPSPRIALGMLALATLDWVATGMVLAAFLPADAHIDVLTFLGAYVAAQSAAVVSHVPAGAGVFEVTLLGLLLTTAPAAARAGLLAAMIMYRAVYYVAPLCVALAAASVVEIRRSRRPAPAALRQPWPPAPIAEPGS